MPKLTYKQIGALHGITRDQVDAAKNKGVNIHSAAEMTKHLKGVRHRIKPGTKLLPAVATAQTLEEMEHAIRSATNIDDVKILKEKVLALKGIVAVQTDTRELVPVGEGRQSMTRVCSAARGELMKLTSDLPPRLEGLAASSMSKIIKTEIVTILTRLSDETSALYAP
jgi:hypothetical protein